MKKQIQVTSLVLILTIFCLGFSAATTDSPDQIIGFYWSPDKDAKIEIYMRGQLYFGRFMWLANPRKDVNNPEKALQARNVLGLELLTRFVWNNGIYSGGEIYDPQTGKTYACKLSIEGNKLKVRGYVGISLFGRTAYFERIK
ncbi:MAG: DUF2147 domain-containing protein [Chitinophagaceae bacterium]